MFTATMINFTNIHKFFICDISKKNLINSSNKSHTIKKEILIQMPDIRSISKWIQLKYLQEITNENLKNKTAIKNSMIFDSS